MPTNFVLGYVFMYLGRHEIRQNPDQVFTKPLLWAWAFSALLFCPVTGWSFYAYPAWATVYLRPEFLIPSWSGPVIISFYFLGMVFGSLLAQSLLQRKAMGAYWLTFAFGVFWLLTTTVLTLDEYQHIGTYTEYHAGQAQLMFDNKPFMMALNVMGAAIGLPGALLGYYLWKRSQRLQYIFRN